MSTVLRFLGLWVAFDLLTLSLFFILYALFRRKVCIRVRFSRTDHP